MVMMMMMVVVMATFVVITKQKDEPCFHVLIHLDFVSLSHTHTHKQRVADDDQQL